MAKSITAKLGTDARDSGFLGVDSATNTLQMIDYAHHEIHEGKSWCVGGVGVLGNTEQLVITITTSDSDAHMFWFVKGAGAGNTAWYEVAVNSGGTAKTIMNHNRNSAAASKLTVGNSGTLTTTGTMFQPDRFGSGQNAGGEARTDHEWILKKDTEYAFVIESEAASNNYSYGLSWYEKGGA